MKILDFYCVDGNAVHASTLYTISKKSAIIVKNILTNLILYRILYRMKVTALIPDNLVKEVKHYAHGKNLTESLIVALEEWISLKKIKELNNEINQNPFEFSKDFSAINARSINRKR